MTEDGSTSPVVRSGAQDAAAPFTISEDTDKRSLSDEDLDLKSENADERKLSEEPDMINEDDSELLILITGEEDAPGAFSVSKETVYQSISKDFDARWENADDRKVSEEPDVIHADVINLSELPEVEHGETKEQAEAEATELLRHDDIHSEEIVLLETDESSADSAAREIVSSADTPAYEPTEIPHVRNESEQASPTNSQVEKAVEPHSDEDTEGRTAAEPSDAETALAVEVQDSGTASPYQTLSTTSPDALGKLAEAVELRLDAVSERQIATEPGDAETAVQDEVQDSETSPVVQILSTTPLDALVRLAEDDEPRLVEDTEGRIAVRPLAIDRVVEVRNYKTRPVVQIVSTTSPDALGRLSEAVEPHLDEEDTEGRMAVEPLVVVERDVEVELQDSEKTSPVMPALTTTYPDALEKTIDDTQLVASNGLDAVVVEEMPADGELNVSVDDQPDVQSRTLDESLEKRSSPDFTNTEPPSSSEQPPGVEDGRVHPVEMESVTTDDNAAAAAAAAVAVGDDVGPMASDEPATESVLSARDTFIEHQVNKPQRTFSRPSSLHSAQCQFIIFIFTTSAIQPLTIGSERHYVGRSSIRSSVRLSVCPFSVSASARQHFA